mgnify:CR=1 FL=1
MRRIRNGACTALLLLALRPLAAGAEEDVQAPAVEFLALHSDNKVYILTLDGNLSRGAESRRFDDYPVTNATAPDGRVFSLNRPWRKPGLDIATLVPGRTITDQDFQLREDPRWAGYAPLWMRLSPDGKRLAFCSNEPDRETAKRDGSFRIFTLDLATGDVRGITSFQDAEIASDSPSPECFNWSPDSTKVAFYLHPNQLSASHSARWEPELYVAEPDGFVRKLARGSRVSATLGANITFGPLWSPDGETIYFVSSYEKDLGTLEPGFPITYSVPAKGGEGKKVCLGTPTSITPDGMYVFASGERSTQAKAVYVRVDLETGTVEDLGADWDQAVVSRSGRYVACRPRDGGHVIFTIEGKEVCRVQGKAFHSGDGVPMHAACWVLQK